MRLLPFALYHYLLRSRIANIRIWGPNSLIQFLKTPCNMKVLDFFKLLNVKISLSEGLKILFVMSSEFSINRETF